MDRISRRTAAIAASATLAVDAKAKALKAAGEPVIGFGAGEPDFATPAHIVDAAVEACKDPKNHKYSPAAGLPELREAIAAKTARDTSFAVDAAQVVVTNGGKHALYAACQVLLDPGDEVILPAPYWTSYPECIAVADGVTVAVPTDESSEFKVSVDALEAARTDRTKALVFVSPSNPSGAVYDEESTRAIGEWALENGVWVITDEIYEHLTYGDHRTYSVPTLVPDLAEQCVVLNGVAKTYAMTGWRVGWLVGPTDVAQAATRLQSHSTSNVNNVAQRATLAAVTGDLTAVDEMRSAFHRRGQTMHRMLNEIPDVTCLAPQGAFYAFPDLSAYIGRDVGGRSVASTLELAEVILDDAKVAIVPGEAFGAPGYARLSFALGDDGLVEGVERIHAILTR